MPAPKEIPAGPDMPKASGPYSQAVRAGNLLFVAGQAGIDPASGRPAGAEFEDQARQAFVNLAQVLRAAGSSMQAVVETTVFLHHAAEVPKMNALYAEFFPVDPPVRSTPIVGLPMGLLISIECIAVV